MGNTMQFGAGRGRSGKIALALVSLFMTAGLLAGCTTSNTSAPVAAAIPATPMVAIATADLPGDWGLASYRNEADLARTEKEARVACNNPYKITAGANGGVMMYLADQTQPSEVFLKTGPGGQVYIGPQGPPAVQQDRLVVSYANNVLITEWLDSGVRERYGTMVFVRCGMA